MSFGKGYGTPPLGAPPLSVNLPTVAPGSPAHGTNDLVRAIEAIECAVREVSGQSLYLEKCRLQAECPDLLDANLTTFLGSQADLEPGDRVELVNAVGGPHGASMVTLALGWLRQNQIIGAGDQAHIIAEITWTNGGTTYTVEIDWIDGTIVSLPASAISVFAHFVEVPGVEPWERVGVSAGITHGTRATRMAVTRTFPTVEVEGGASSVAVQIPNFAQTVFVWSPLSPNQFHLVFRGSLGGAIIETTSATAIETAKHSGGIQIPGFARFVEVVNTLADSEATIGFGINL